MQSPRVPLKWGYTFLIYLRTLLKEPQPNVKKFKIVIWHIFFRKNSETLQTWQLYQTYIQIIKECIYVRTYLPSSTWYTYSFHDHTDSYLTFQNMKMERKGSALFVQCEISTIKLNYVPISSLISNFCWFLDQLILSCKVEHKNKIKKMEIIWSNSKMLDP